VESWGKGIGLRNLVLWAREIRIMSMFGNQILIRGLAKGARIAIVGVAGEKSES